MISHPSPGGDKWRPVTRSEPCPACQHVDWCAWEPCGQRLRCMRSGSTPAGMVLLSADDGAGGTIYGSLDSPAGHNGHHRPPQRDDKPVHAVDLAAIHAACRARLQPAVLAVDAGKLGIAPAALEALEPGWASRETLKLLRASGDGWQDRRPSGALTIPERDGSGAIVGFSLRTADGRKGAPSSKVGARRGLVYSPAMLERSSGSVLVVEGATDVMAAITLGIPAVGRPAAKLGRAALDDLAKLLAGRDVIVIAERDEKPDGTWPGRDGAIDTAQRLAAAWGRPVRWALLPDGEKDLRAWLARWAAEGLVVDDAEGCAGFGDELVESLEATDETINPPPQQQQPQATTQPAPALERLTEGALVLCGDRGNIGTVVNDDGGPTVLIHFRSPDGNEVDKSLPREVLRMADGSQVPGGPPAPQLPPVIGIGELVHDFPQQPEPIVDGLLRRGETMNIIAAAKAGKSWLSYDLALSVATGGNWLGQYPCAAGRVLIVDNELHPPTIAKRLPIVADAIGIALADIAANVDVLPLRGRMVDLLGLRAAIDRIERGYYSLIVADAWYRFLPPGTSENDNAQIMALFNVIDSYTAALGCAWVNIHHASKGGQGEKTVVDVGAGAGAQSRAADTHIVLRPHIEPDAAVLEAAVRSFPPVEALPLRWEWPLWRPATDLDARQLRDKQSGHEKRAAEKDQAARDAILAALEAGPATARELRAIAKVSAARCERVLIDMIRAGDLQAETVRKRGNECDQYTLTTQSGVVV